MNMRTSKPGAGNKFYITKAKGGYSTCIQGSPTDSQCNVLANCVGYACGRFNEIIGSMKYPSLNCNAENFIERAKSIGLQISKVPTLGGIMVWQKGNTLKSSDGAGHVEVVEKIYDSNHIYTSSSGYGSKAFWNSHRYNNNGKWGIGSGYTFRGCIINPSVKEEKSKSIDELANEVLAGKWGNGADRKKNLTNAGYDYSKVQAKVNELCKKTTTSSKKITFKVGDKVVPIKLVNNKGAHLKQYDSYYYITKLSNNDATLSAKRGNKYYIWATLNISNIKKV